MRGRTGRGKTMLDGWSNHLQGQDSAPWTPGSGDKGDRVLQGLAKRLRQRLRGVKWKAGGGLFLRTALSGECGLPPGNPRVHIPLELPHRWQIVVIFDQEQHRLKFCAGMIGPGATEIAL